MQAALDGHLPGRGQVMQSHSACMPACSVHGYRVPYCWCCPLASSGYYNVSGAVDLKILTKPLQVATLYDGMPYTLSAALALQPQTLGPVAVTATLGVGHICAAVAPAVSTSEACTIDQPQYQAAMVAACDPAQSLLRRSNASHITHTIHFFLREVGWT